VCSSVKYSISSINERLFAASSGGELALHQKAQQCRAFRLGLD
jgi:hypothetical protein